MIIDKIQYKNGDNLHYDFDNNDERLANFDNDNAEYDLII